MTTLMWDQIPREYDSGLSRGVIFADGPGVAWNGLISANEKNPGGNLSGVFLDGVKYRDLVANEDYNLTLNVYTYPDEFEEEKPFGLTYRINTTEGYKIHILYNCVAVLSERGHQTQQQNTVLDTFAYDLSTRPVPVDGFKPSAHFIADSTLADPRSISALEDILYGTIDDDPRFPDESEVVDIFAAYPGLIVTLYEDGSFDVTGPDDAVIVDGTEWSATWPSVIYESPDTYRISTL